VTIPRVAAKRSGRGLAPYLPDADADATPPNVLVVVVVMDVLVAPYRSDDEIPPGPASSRRSLLDAARPALATAAAAPSNASVSALTEGGDCSLSAAGRLVEYRASLPRLRFRSFCTPLATARLGANPATS